MQGSTCLLDSASRPNSRGRCLSLQEHLHGAIDGCVGEKYWALLHICSEIIHGSERKPHDVLPLSHFHLNVHNLLLGDACIVWVPCKGGLKRHTGQFVQVFTNTFLHRHEVVAGTPQNLTLFFCGSHWLVHTHPSSLPQARSPSRPCDLVCP